jgi:S-methylmethionine-dependent homocysteine/selenocysteine methylase
MHHDGAKSLRGGVSAETRLCERIGPRVDADWRPPPAPGRYDSAVSRWQEVLASGGTLVLDGGTGTELRRRGCPLRDDVWSALASDTHYAELRDVHSAYIEAGADVVTTNTFATTRFVLEAAGQAERFEIIVARTVAAALEARDASGRDVAIAGSISCLPPRFDVSAYPDERSESEAYFELAESLAEAGVDLLALEMLEETRHAPLACAAAARVGLPVWLGISARLGAGNALVGFDFPLVPFETCLDALLPFAPLAVNVMHSPVDAIEPALLAIRARWPGLIGAYPEIGDGTDTAPSVTPPELAARARRWIAAGARIVGGCCGTTPEHVRALASLRAQLRR